MWLCEKTAEMCSTWTLKSMFDECLSSLNVHVVNDRIIHLIEADFTWCKNQILCWICHQRVRCLLIRDDHCWWIELNEELCELRWVETWKWLKVHTSVNWKEPTSFFNTQSSAVKSKCDRFNEICYCIEKDMTQCELRLFLNNVEICNHIHDLSSCSRHYDKSVLMFLIFHQKTHLTDADETFLIKWLSESSDTVFKLDDDSRSVHTVVWWNSAWMLLRQSRELLIDAKANFTETVFASFAVMNVHFHLLQRHQLIYNMLKLHEFHNFVQWNVREKQQWSVIKMNL